jgi:DNA-binding transcriptional LysR family regulator
VRYQAGLEIGSNEVITRAVEIGSGVGILSRALVRQEVQAGHLRALRVRERGFSRPLYLAYHRMREQSPLIQAVVKVAGDLRKHRVRKA